jgi:hypothetical protein
LCAKRANDPFKMLVALRFSSGPSGAPGGRFINIRAFINRRSLVYSYKRGGCANPESCAVHKCTAETLTRPATARRSLASVQAVPSQANLTRKGGSKETIPSSIRPPTVGHMTEKISNQELGPPGRLPRAEFCSRGRLLGQSQGLENSVSGASNEHQPALKERRHAPLQPKRTRS